MVDTTTQPTAPEFKVDITKPASAAEFAARGVSPAEAAMLAEAHETMAGRRSADARAALSVTDPAPPGAKLPPGATVTQTEATTALEAHEAAQLNAEMDKMFAPPASPSDYRFPPPVHDVTDEDIARDSGIKAVFHSTGFPRWLGENIVNELSAGERVLSRLPPGEVSARLTSTGESLKRMWGREYDRNIVTVEDLLLEMDRRNPSLGIGGSVRLDNGQDVPLLALLDSQTVNSLVEFAKHRANRR
jgi:hypothetical protein